MSTSAVTEQNPLLQGLHIRRRPEPCVVVIFGASGDLTSRKLMPALYALAVRKLLPERFAIVGAARSDESDDEFRERMKEAVQRNARDEFRQDVWDELAAGMRYCPLDFGEGSGQDRLATLLADVDRERGTDGNRVYYFAVPPSAIATLIRQIAARRSSEGWVRLIIEKPFGHDLAYGADAERAARGAASRSARCSASTTTSARRPCRTCSLCDSRTGSSSRSGTASSSTTCRSPSPSRWGSRVAQPTTSSVGAVRDIFQNHLLQLVAITAMEPPIDFTADSVRNEKVKVLRSLHTPAAKSVVRGQYGRGFVEGVEVPAYREEEGVAPDSMTETYVAAKLYVDNWRWADTPFYVRMGKRLARRETTIAIQFKRAPHPPFEELAAEGLRPNVLLIHVQPNEGMSLAIGAKVPGLGMTIRTVHMDFLYGSSFREGLPEAYERLILDAMLGDPTLFTRSDEIEEQWALVDAIVSAWERERQSFPNYPAGTWGPPSADDLVHRDGRSWRRH